MRRSRWVFPLLALPVLAGCAPSATPSASGSSSTSSAAAPATAAGSTGPAPAAGASGTAGCEPGGGGTPSDAATARTLDVDGDGRADTMWIAHAPVSGGVPFGVTTARGRTFSAAINSGSPRARQLLIADVTGKGELVAFASDGRQVLLFALSGCSFVPVKNTQGQQYAFDLGFTGYGTGVGCVDANGDGTPDLVGLKYVPEPHGEGSIQRTIVELNGPSARNGATDTVLATNAQLADEARAVSCGDLSLAANGVSSGP